MAITNYKGFNIQSANNSSNVWQVKIKNHVLTGSLVAVKKSVDWWCDTASIIDPKEFASIGQNHSEAVAPGQSENFNGYLLKNDSGEANAWYCMFNNRLIKGSKIAIQKHIEAYLIAKQKAQQQQTTGQRK
ncbi:MULTISPECIES: DUF3319 domain-containing protein [Vibrio]|uniref:Phage tail protein n=2 Tax=Vibrio TaxID=662 RepID=A0A1E5CLT4_9VIBR|nr:MULTISPECIES: DUF3319 domain-containing protein [Vibrio]RBW65154.1 DUF3319 domain-containing protein [Vibrionales bacterium C3R12]MDN3695740.1 DUF3319 domain-containing protein [Vibrio cortegadensis]NOH83729.1 DUF3319 domain-containing protein [Vibrio sp. 03-59-1]OEE70415.1 phage tail protein [Vibrio genomosp. F6 str. FF-238]TKF21209.1 DUF3319 domain-containing protein [Vibrio genomosp. F6]